MGNYISSSDLERRLTSDELVQLADLDEDGTADTAVISQAISDAESLVNSYVGARTTVPLATVPDHVKTLCINLAIYYLHLGRRSVTEDIQKQFEADMRQLRDIAAGRAALGDEDASAGEVHPTTRYDGPPRRFTRDELDEW